MKIKNNFFIYSLCSLLSLMNIFPFTIYGENKIVDSIGSINMEDDGMNVGVDKTQEKTTTYSEEITNESLETSDNKTLVYVSQASNFSIYVPKTIILDGKTKEANYKVKVNGNIGGLENISVVPNENFKLSQFGKNDIIATITQNKTSWKYNEMDIEGNGNIIANDMTAGKWNGKFDFSISLNKGSLVMVSAKDSNGNDLQASASEILGEEKKILLNSLVESGFISSNNDVNALIDVKSNEFDNFADTTFNVTNIANSGDTIVILHFNEITNEWEYISTEIVDENGLINTNFSSFSPIAFVKINENGEYIKHECIYMDGVCIHCKSKEPGLYNDSGIMIASWEQTELDIEKDYTNTTNATNNYITCQTSGYYVLTNKYPDATKIILPNGINNIGAFSFYNCTNLKEIIIPNSVKSINLCAFVSCTGLTNIKIPNSVTIIDENAFTSCRNLETIDLGSNVKTIGNYAFQNCIKLSNITLPNSLTNIGSSAFYYCSELTTITIPKNVTNIGIYPFDYCSKLTNVIFEETNGWYVGNYAGTPVKTTLINSSDLEDTTLAATYLKSTYNKQYWSK